MRIAAERAVLDAYVEVAHLDTSNPEREFADGRAVGLGIAVRHLASRYSHDRNYQPEWRP
jgi:uncharacterized protein DUF6221